MSSNVNVKANEISKKAEDFYKELERKDNHRYYSWEHCYSAFYEASRKKVKERNYDYLALQLAFYLASWGMYRPSSFLLQYDYKVHIEPIEKYLFNSEYEELFGIEWSKLNEEELKEKLDLLKNLSKDLKEYYKKLRFAINGKEIKTEISDDLVTKILLGTLGCVPAYDRYFKKAVRKTKITNGNYNNESIKKIIDYYKGYEDVLERTREGLKIKGTNIKYPQMKIIDMTLWKIGEN